MNPAAIWKKENGHWLRDGSPCHPNRAQLEEMIRWRDIEIDRLWDELSKSRRSEPGHEEYWRLPG